MTNEELILEKLARIEARLEGVDRVEQQMAAFAGPWENLSDLGRDLSLLMDPAVRKLTEEMVEVEIGFQLEDFFDLIKRLLPRLKYLTWSLEQLENLVDWWTDMEPLLKLAVPKLIDYLDDLEQKGIFRINAAVLEMYGKIAANYNPEDIDAMGDGFVRMHGVVKKLSNPGVDPISRQGHRHSSGCQPGGDQAGRSRWPALADAEPGMPGGSGRLGGTHQGPGQTQGGSGGSYLIRRAGRVRKLIRPAAIPPDVTISPGLSLSSCADRKNVSDRQQAPGSAPGAVTTQSGRASCPALTAPQYVCRC